MATFHKVFRRMQVYAFGAALSAIGFVAPTTAQEAGSTSHVTEGTVKLADSNIEYFSQGEGEAVVLLPGGSLTVDYLDDLAHSVAAAGYRAVRVNFRGAGKSAGSGTDVTLHTLAGDVAGVIQALKLGPVHVAGHAFGNRVARMLAADHPELVRSVILFAAGGKVPGKPPAERALMTIFNPASSQAEVLEAMKYMVGKSEDVATTWQMFKSSRAPLAAGIQRTASENTPLEAWWAPAGKQKYLVVQGTDDQAAPPENGELLKKELGARVTLVSFPGAGHLMVMTEPEQSAAAIVSFLR